jgi:hypothetical protein
MLQHVEHLSPEENADARKRAAIKNSQLQDSHGAIDARLVTPLRCQSDTKDFVEDGILWQKTVDSAIVAFISWQVERSQLIVQHCLFISNALSMEVIVCQTKHSRYLLDAKTVAMAIYPEVD